MAVDNTLRYRGFNSYNLEAGETLYSSLSDCEYLGFVTTQWVALKVGGTIAGGEVRITWIDDTGGQFGNAERYEFTPTRLWERYTWTIAVPPEAVKLRIQFEGGTQGYHFACPMTEPGEIASSFDPNLASAVAYMTSEGAYVGFLNAEQIIAGLLRAVNGGAWFDLDKPEIVMEGKQADLSITPENPLKLTDKSGQFIGGLGVAGGILGLVAGALTNDPNMNAYATIGYPAEGGVGISIYEKDHPDVYMGRFGSDTFGISLDHKGRLFIGNQGGAEIWDAAGNKRLDIAGIGSTQIRDAAGKSRFLSTADGSTYIYDQNGVTRLSIGDETYIIDKNDVARMRISDNYTSLGNQSGVARLQIGDDYTYLKDKDNVIRLWIDPSGNTFMQNAVNSHTIGVDNTGPYFTKSGAKSYFKEDNYLYKDHSVASNSTLNITTGSTREIYLVLTTQGAALTGKRTAWLVFCANSAGYDGSALRIAGSTTNVDVQQSYTSAGGFINISNLTAGTLYATVIKLV